MPIARSAGIQKPFNFQIGNLPMKLVFDDTNKPISFINSCSSVGLTRDMNHMNKNDTIGTIVDKNGILFWAYKSFSSSPPTSSSNLNMFQIDIRHDFISIILSIIHDFLRDVPEETYKKIYKRKNKLFIHYEDNKLLYIYPYTILIKHCVNNKVVIYQNIYLYPLENYKTRLFIATNDIIYKFFLYIFYLSFNSSPTNNFKYKYLLINNPYSNIIIKMFDDYMSIFDDSTIYHFIINRKYY